MASLPRSHTSGLSSFIDGCLGSFFFSLPCIWVTRTTDGVFYGLRHMDWSTDSCPSTGIAAYALLLWLNLSTLAPFRNFSYEFFVIQHLITFFGFIIAVMIHLPSTASYSRVYIYIPIALYVIDRLIRTLRFACNNIRPGYATLTAFKGGVPKFRLPNPQVRKWRPGTTSFSKSHISVSSNHTPRPSPQNPHRTATI